MPIMNMGEIATDFIVGNESAIMNQAMVISSSSLVPITGLEVPVMPHLRYILKSNIYYRSYELTSGIGFSVNGPVGFDYLKYDITLYDNEGEKNSDIFEEYNQVYQGVGVSEAGKLYLANIDLCLGNGENEGLLRILTNVELDGNAGIIDMGSYVYMTQLDQ